MAPGSIREYMMALATLTCLSPNPTALWSWVARMSVTSPSTRALNASNGISNEVAYVYLATGVELGEIQREPTELMEMRLVPIEEARRMAGEGEITDGPSALALLRCEPLLRPLKQQVLDPGIAQ